MIYNPK